MLWDADARFGPYQASEAIAQTKVGALAGAVLINSCRKVGCDADIHRAAIAIRHDVDPAALCHGSIVKERDPGSSPGRRLSVAVAIKEGTGPPREPPLPDGVPHPLHQPLIKPQIMLGHQHRAQDLG